MARSASHLSQAATKFVGTENWFRSLHDLFRSRATGTSALKRKARQGSSFRRRPPRQDSHAIDSVVELLIPLSRLMIRSKFGAGELVRAAKLSFVRAAANEVTPKGARPNVSRLSVVTGLTRKEVSALLGKRLAQRVRQKPAMEQRALRVLRGWRVDPLFQSPNGRPAALPLRGHRRAFPQLVKTYAGDVTPVSVLKELERMELVTKTRSGKLHLRSRRTRTNGHSSPQLSDLAKVFSDFASTASRDSNATAVPAFFGFRESSVSSPEQASLFHRTYSRRAAMMLESIEQWVNHQRRSKSRTALSKRRIGIGIYLINDPPSN
jgi:hypothetical protein